MSRPTIERVRQLLAYDPASGVFRWLQHRHCVRAGSVAGSVNTKGYLVIGIDDEDCYGHRLAWLLQTGEWPTAQIDHADGNPGNNNWDNLRQANPSQNGANKRVRNRSGLKGITQHGRRWRASVRKNGVTIFRESFPSAEEAHAAYCKVAQETHGHFARAK